MRLKGGDRLVCIGGTNAVAELRAIPGLRPATDQLFKLSGNGERKLVEVVLSSFSPAVGRTLVQCAFRSRYNAAVLAISRRGQRPHHKPGRVELQAGDTLLVETAGGLIRSGGRRVGEWGVRRWRSRGGRVIEKDNKK